MAGWCCSSAKARAGRFTPAPGSTAPTPSPADVTAVRGASASSACRKPSSGCTRRPPSCSAVARSAGLSVLDAPLMVLDPGALPDPATLPARRAGARPGVPRLRRRRRRQARGRRGRVRRRRHRPRRGGPGRTDAAVTELGAAALDEERVRIAAAADLRAGRHADRGRAGQRHGERVGDVAEIAGVATLPSARRRGLGAALTATLARHSLDAGTDLVFLLARAAKSRPRLPAGRLPPNRHRLHRRARSPSPLTHRQRADLPRGRVRSVVAPLGGGRRRPLERQAGS